MGAEWGGWWLVWNTLCQIWKESPYIDQTVATSYIREIGFSSSQYIDDRHLGELWGPSPGARSRQKLQNCDRPTRLPLYANVYSDLCL